jgi:hypothetical protein
MSSDPGVPVAQVHAEASTANCQTKLTFCWFGNSKLPWQLLDCRISVHQERSLSACKSAHLIIGNQSPLPSPPSIQASLPHHFEITYNSFRFHFEFTLNSLRSHFDATLVFLGVGRDVTHRGEGGVINQGVQLIN